MYPSPETPRTPKNVARRLFSTRPSPGGVSRSPLRFPAAAARAAGRVAVASAARAVPAASAVLNAAAAVRELRDMFTQTPSKLSFGGKRKAQTYSSGKKLKAPKKSKLSALEKHTNSGIVYRQQVGDVSKTARNVMYLAHSTMPVRTVLYVAWQSLYKKLFTIAGLKMKNVSSPLFDNQYYNGIIELRYKAKDGSAITTQNFNVTNNSTTLSQLADFTVSYFEGLTSTALPQQFLTLRYYIDQSGVIATAKILQAEIDLSSVSFKFDVLSEFKMQNKTINSEGNDEADEVDNVPVKGRIYEYKSNGTMYRDYTNTALTSACTTDNKYGLLPTAVGSDTETKMYEEVPLRNQFIGVNKTSTFVIQPGTLRFDKFNDSLKINFSKFMNICYAKPYTTGGTGQFTQVWLGKTRLFAIEKYIHDTIVANSTAVNVTQIGWQSNLQIGCTTKIKQSTQTAPEVSVGVAPAIN